MKSSVILSLAAGLGSVRAAIAPLCNACNQDACMDAVVQEECGEYLVIVETPSTKTIVETVLATFVPTHTANVSISTTILNNATTTVHVSATHTVDFTVTEFESETATETDTMTDTETITVDPLPTVYRRHASVTDRFGYDLPEYASVCTDIYQYSSACDCIGFVPSTSTAAAPETTTTVTETVIPSTAVLSQTIATLSFTRIVTTIPVTATVTTVPVSRAVDTVTETTTVATTTTTITETTTSTVTRTPTVAAPRPTVTGQIRVADGSMAENINIPPGAEIGVILTIRQTTNPATFLFTPEGPIILQQTPSTTVPYSLYYYSNTNAGYSYVQITTKRISDILSVQAMTCAIGDDNKLQCFHNGEPAEIWTCGRHTAIVFNGRSQSFIGQCSTSATKVEPEVVRLG